MSKLQGDVDRLWGPLTLEERFGTLTGAVLVDRIFEIYELPDSPKKVDWLNVSGTPQIVRHELTESEATRFCH